MICPNPNCKHERFADRRYCQYCGYDYWEDRPNGLIQDKELEK